MCVCVCVCVCVHIHHVHTYVCPMCEFMCDELAKALNKLQLISRSDSFCNVYSAIYACAGKVENIPPIGQTNN